MSVQYDFDGSGQPLQVGRYYQLRLYASEGDFLLSTSENIDGIIKVVSSQ
jgi:hypothetical protein